MLKEAKNYLKGYKQTTESAFFRNVHERGRDIIEKKTFYGSTKKAGTYDCIIIEKYGWIIKVYDEPAMGFGRVNISYWIPANSKQL